MRFLVAYDIADPSRLRRVARRLEREALRCQKSVFVFDGSEKALLQVLEGLLPVIKLDEDIVQAWRLGKGETISGTAYGVLANIRPASAVLHSSGNLLVQRGST